MTPGCVVVLDGVSSAGKSTLAAALQSRLVIDGEPWIVMAMDDLFAKLPSSFVTPGEHADRGVTFDVGDGFEVRMGPVGLQLLEGARMAVGAVARAGTNVIVDEIVMDDVQWDGWQRALGGLDVTWVRVLVSLEIAEAREQARGDRPSGMARWQHPVVHGLPTYGITVDTGELSPDAAAEAIVSALR